MKAGKGVLIKVVAETSYAMSYFDPTKTLCDKISNVISRFRWAQHDKKNKITLVLDSREILLWL